MLGLLCGWLWGVRFWGIEVGVKKVRFIGVCCFVEWKGEHKGTHVLLRFVQAHRSWKCRALQLRGRH